MSTRAFVNPPADPEPEPEPETQPDSPGFFRRVIINPVRDAATGPQRRDPGTPAEELAANRRGDLLGNLVRGDPGATFGGEGAAQAFFDGVSTYGQPAIEAAYSEQEARRHLTERERELAQAEASQSDDPRARFAAGFGESGPASEERITALERERDTAETQYLEAVEQSDAAGVNEEVRDFVTRNFQPNIPSVVGLRGASAGESAIDPTGPGGVFTTGEEQQEIAQARAADAVDVPATGITAITGPGLLFRAGAGGARLIASGAARQELRRRAVRTTVREGAQETLEEGTFVAADFSIAGRSPSVPGSIGEIGGETALEVIGSARRGSVVLPGPDSDATVDGQPLQPDEVIFDPDQDVLIIGGGPTGETEIYTVDSTARDPETGETFGGRPPAPTIDQRLAVAGVQSQPDAAAQSFEDESLFVFDRSRATRSRAAISPDITVSQPLTPAQGNAAPDVAQPDTAAVVPPAAAVAVAEPQPVGQATGTEPAIVPANVQANVPAAVPAQAQTQAGQGQQQAQSQSQSRIPGGLPVLPGGAGSGRRPIFRRGQDGFPDRATYRSLSDIEVDFNSGRTLAREISRTPPRISRNGASPVRNKTVTGRHTTFQTDGTGRVSTIRTPTRRSTRGANSQRWQRTARERRRRDGTRRNTPAGRGR